MNLRLSRKTPSVRPPPISSAFRTPRTTGIICCQSNFWAVRDFAFTGSKFSIIILWLYSTVIEWCQLENVPAGAYSMYIKPWQSEVRCELAIWMAHVITSLWISKEDQLVSLDLQNYKFPPSQCVFLCAMYHLLSLELRVIIIPGRLRLSNREKCLLMHMVHLLQIIFLPKYYTSNKCASLRLAIGFWIQGSELF